MKVVILCGGVGLRLTGREPSMPKALVEIGGRPILWHIMRHYAHHGFNEFILCLGYFGEAIKQYFVAREPWRDADLRLRAGPGNRSLSLLGTGHEADFDIIFADTGPDTNSGGRIKQVAQYIEGDEFLATYCDGLWDGDPNALLAHHHSKAKLATVTVVHPPSPFGVVDLDENDLVTRFEEKPRLRDWINGGFFAFRTEALQHFRDNDELERGTLARLVQMGELAAFRHEGYWQCMDTYKEMEFLNSLWQANRAPWKVWD